MATAPTPSPVEVRELSALGADDAPSLGGEAEALGVLRAHHVPLAEGCVAPLDADLDALAAYLRARLAGPTPARRPSLAPASLEPPAPRVRLRPWFKTVAHQQRSRASLDPADVRDPAGLRQALAAFVAQARGAASVPARGEHRPDALFIRALVCDSPHGGLASSVGGGDADPSFVSVRVDRGAGAAPWRIERKTMRIVRDGAGELPPEIVERVADLADRAQLALGWPVELEWVLVEGWPAVARVRPIEPAWRFTDTTLRLVEVLWHDEGPMAPLSVDALDKALRERDDPVDVPRVRRMFARPYRRLEAGRGRGGERRQAFFAAAARAAQVLRDVARPIGAARAFARSLDDRLFAFDRDPLRDFDDGELARALRERQQVVIEAYRLLDRGRQATAAVLGALEAALGTVPTDCVHGLAAIRRTRARRRLDERLAKVAARLRRASGGELPAALDPAPAALRETFGALRRELSDKRPLGLDVLPDAYGSSDASLLDGMRAALDGRAEAAEREQRQAIRRLMDTVRSRPLGRGRAALARSLVLTLERLAVAKGRVAEGLADANLRLREVARVLGERLVERGILDEPEDALYLYAAELVDALYGEPGAYTAKARLRREEDARWRRFSPPTRLVTGAGLNRGAA